MDWRSGSTGREPALQVRNPEFKTPVPLQKKSQTKNRGRAWLYMLVTPFTQESENGKITVLNKANTGTNLLRLHLHKQARQGGYICNPSYPGGRGRRILV
jgi:hypothetical protein